MKKIEFTKRNFSQELLSDYPDAVFINSQYNFNDAIIGVTDDGRIVYASYHMDAVIFSEDEENGYDYTEDHDNEDNYFDYVSEQVSMTQQSYGSTYYYKNPAIFCDDGEFLENTYRLLKENERSSFKYEMDDEEE